MKSFFTLDLAVDFYQTSKSLKLPAHLKSQFLRACSSISLNLSEGSAKPTIADRRKFYYVALGSLRECQIILKLHGQTPAVLVKQADCLGICLYRLCRALK